LKKRFNIESEFTPDYDEYMALNPLEISELLKDSKTVAIVGISDKPERPSYGVAQFLLENSHFDLYFVNPLIEEVLGKKVYKSLAEIPVHIDIVDVFRKPADCQVVLDESIEIGAGAVWLQLGINVPEVETMAESAGVKVVMNRCIKIDYAAL
jgi:predicted CoA-binding protein